MKTSRTEAWIAFNIGILIYDLFFATAVPFVVSVLYSGGVLFLHWALNEQKDAGDQQ